MSFPVRLHARASLCSDFHVMVVVKRNHHALLKFFNGKPNYRGLYCYWKLEFANESSAFIFDILMKNNYMNHAWAMMSIIEESRTPGIAELYVLGFTVILKCAKFFRSLTTPLLPFMPQNKCTWWLTHAQHQDLLIFTHLWYQENSLCCIFCRHGRIRC